MASMDIDVVMTGNLSAAQLETLASALSRTVSLPARKKSVERSLGAR